MMGLSGGGVEKRLGKRGKGVGAEDLFWRVV